MQTPTVTCHDKCFEIYLPEKEVLQDIKRIAQQLNKDYEGKKPIFIAVLNGSFMFASDLLKEITIACEISFVKVSSYENTSSTGQVKDLVGLKEDISGRHVILLEDIVDTGNTMVVLLEMLQIRNPASIEVATLLQKPECLQHQLSVKYVGRNIPNDFVIGYGLDYNGLGRNFKDIYKVID